MINSLSDFFTAMLSILVLIYAMIKQRSVTVLRIPVLSFSIVPGDEWKLFTPGVRGNLISGRIEIFTSAAISTPGEQRVVRHSQPPPGCPSSKGSPMPIHSLNRRYLSVDGRFPPPDHLRTNLRNGANPIRLCAIRRLINFIRYLKPPQTLLGFESFLAL